MIIKESEIQHLFDIAKDVNNNDYSSIDQIRPIAIEVIENYGNKLFSMLYLAISDDTTTWENFRDLGVLFSALMFYSSKQDLQAGNMFFMLGRYSFCFAYNHATNRTDKSSVVFQAIRMIVNSYAIANIPIADSGKYAKMNISFCDELQNIFTFAELPELNYRSNSALYAQCIQYYLCDYLVKQIGSDECSIDKAKLMTYKEYASDDLTINNVSLENALAVGKKLVALYIQDIQEKGYEDCIENINEKGQFDLYKLTLGMRNGIKVVCFHDIEAEMEERIREYDYNSEASDEDYDDLSYSRYKGSYAHDEMGYTDDDIDTIFDGDPNAYWNID